jgi:hypothetical protein
MWLRLLTNTIGFVDEHFHPGIRDDISALSKALIIGLVMTTIFVVLAVATLPVLILAATWR